MYLTGAYADATGEQRWHFAIPALLGAAGLLAIPFTNGHIALAILAITLAAMGTVTASAMFWPIPTAMFGGLSAAASLAIVNSLGNLGGFAGPFAIGWLVDISGSTSAGMMALVVVLTFGAVLSLCAIPAADARASRG